MRKRAYYQNEIVDFLSQEKEYILGILAENDQFTTEHLQKSTWIKEIDILKRELLGCTNGYLLFEYTIPRIGKRVDNIVLYNGIIFVLEFKGGGKQYKQADIDQVMDYALDLKYFHKQSWNKKIVPILIEIEAPDQMNTVTFNGDGVAEVILCNGSNLGGSILNIGHQEKQPSFGYEEWINSMYKPTPTIIEAAQVLYQGHCVEEIYSNDAGAGNLSKTASIINKIIDRSKENKEKSICFITGVPGAGKTLAGLNIANQRQQYDEDEHAVFLSGNQPLVAVLQEALARDESTRFKNKKSEALKKAMSFIQIIHHFRDDAISVTAPPNEKIAIFDEAQRAWDSKSLSDFMLKKKRVTNFYMSEPEFLISIMDRHQEWAVIICLVCGGQEINKGEAGLKEWFKALKDKYPNWNVYVSDKIGEKEYVGDETLQNMMKGLRFWLYPELHLSVSLRSYRSEKVSEFVKYLLDGEKELAQEMYSEIKVNYPIVMTRNLEDAKIWVKKIARGTQRYGMTASSGGRRLRADGVWVEAKIDAKHWFLNSKEDVRSSYYLETAATEFDIQGLELDWSIVCWDANFRFSNHKFEYFRFKGSKWEHVRKDIDQSYIKNAYRVLLTRARQGFVVYVPEGDDRDPSRLKIYYNGVYEYLKDLGIEDISMT